MGTLDATTISSLGDLDYDDETPMCVFFTKDYYPGNICVATNDDGVMESLDDKVSEVSILTQISDLPDTLSQLMRNRVRTFVTSEVEKIYQEEVLSLSPLGIKGMTLKRRDPDEEPGLAQFQSQALYKALHAPVYTDSEGKTTQFYFFSAGTGTGKGVMGTVGALELFNRDEIDLVLFFTLRQVKSDIVNNVNSFTPRVGVNIEGDKQKRTKRYLSQEHDVYVMNYEKAKFDYEALHKLVKGKRVLFVLDEVQKVLNNNQSRQALDQLMYACQHRVIWPMSASVVQGDPERFWRIYEWCPAKPLGSLKQFRKDYLERSFQRKVYITTKYGKRKAVYYTDYVYDEEKLVDIRHRVSLWTSSIRKTDPGVRDWFKGLRFVPVPVEMSKEDAKIYDHILEEGKGRASESFNALRYLCLSPLSITVSEDQFCKELTESSKLTFTNKNNNKLERMMEDIESVQGEGDKVIVFTHWTTLSIFFIEEELKKRKIPYVIHHGRMKDSAMAQSRHEFKTNPDITVLLSSDAGAHGMNMPESRYVFSYDCPYDYDLLMQRNDRIDRADSYLDNLEARVYYYQGTVEEKIWQINNKRRYISSVVQGTSEELHRPPAGSVEDELLSLSESSLSEIHKRWLMGLS